MSSMKAISYTLDKAIQIAQSYEYTQDQLRTMTSPLVEVHAVRNIHKTSAPRAGQPTSQYKVKAGTDLRWEEDFW